MRTAGHARAHQDRDLLLLRAPESAAAERQKKVNPPRPTAPCRPAPRRRRPRKRLFKRLFDGIEDIVEEIVDLVD